MSVYLSSVVSAPAYQTCFSVNPSTYLKLSTTTTHHHHHQDRLKDISVESQDDDQVATDSDSSLRSTTSSNLQIKTLSTSNPTSPLSNLSSPATTRLRAMGNLTEALERRRAKENIQSNPSHLPKLTTTALNTRRDEKKALGLRAAVGSYKMRCSGTQSLSASPVTSDKFEIPIKSLQTTSSIEPKPLETVTNMTWVADTPESRLKHSQYLAARRESIIGRVSGGHRRVGSESSKTGVKASSAHLRPTPSITTLPSLDQISSWVALRKNHVSDPMEEDSNLSSSSTSWHDYSMNSTQPFSPLKQKSLPIFSHARDPSIPRICLSPDSDEEDDCNDQSDETQSEPPCSAIPMILDSSALKSANPSLEPHRLDFNCTLIASSTPSPSNHRALQRQALLTNLALARRRRTTNETSTPQYVAPV